MKSYEYEARERFTPSPLNGVMIAENEIEAISELKEIYAQELGTTEDEINVTLVEYVS